MAESKLDKKSENWLISQEFRWRAMASAIWSFMLAVILSALFLLVWSFAPFQHGFVLYDYLVMISSAKIWFLIISTSMLITLYNQCFISAFKVTRTLSSSRLTMWAKIFQPQNLFLGLCHGVLAGLVVYLVVASSESQFSSLSLLCSQPGTSVKAWFLNESLFILILFSVVVGVSHFISLQNNSQYSLNFTQTQPGRLIALKCHFFNALQPSMKTSHCYLQYFLLAYYCAGFVARDIFSVLLGYPIRHCYLLSIWNLPEVLGIVWCLWIVGVFLVLIHTMSWDLFNIYQTKMQPFLIDSVFPEDSHKLLGSCLNNKQPLLVQHWAFQYLYHISSYSSLKRKQLFAVVYEGNKTQGLKWDGIADECLARINGLTQQLKDYQLKLSGNNENKKTSKISTTSQSSEQSSSQSQDILSVSALRRRPLHSDMTLTPNLSCFQMSPLIATSNLNTSNLNTTNLNNSLNPNTLNTSRTLHVPTPKLWYREKIFSTPNTGHIGQDTQLSVVQDENMQLIKLNGVLRNLADKFTSYFKQLSFISYFIKKIPDREAANLYSDHFIHKWAIQSISLLSAFSLKEDSYGVVQRRLKEIVTALLDLLMALEKNGKLSVNTTSSTVTLSLLRHHQSLKTCTKSAIYRITNTFGEQLGSIQVGQEYNRRLKSFAENRG